HAARREGRRWLKHAHGPGRRRRTAVPTAPATAAASATTASGNEKARQPEQDSPLSLTHFGDIIPNEKTSQCTQPRAFALAVRLEVWSDVQFDRLQELPGGLIDERRQVLV